MYVFLKGVPFGKHIKQYQKNTVINIKKGDYKNPRVIP